MRLSSKYILTNTIAIITASLVLTMTSCVNPDQSVPFHSQTSLSDDGDLITANDITGYEIEAVASSFEFDLRSGVVGPQLPPPNAVHHPDILKALKKLLEGPCLKDAEKIFEKLLSEIDLRIKRLSELLQKETDQDKIDKLQKRIEALEELEKEIKLKKDECAQGVSKCSDKFKENLIKEIARLEDKIKELDDKISKEQNEKRKDHLEREVERFSKIKDRLRELLDKCK